MSISDFSLQLSELAQADQLRTRRIIDGAQDAAMLVDGKRVNLCEQRLPGAG